MLGVCEENEENKEKENNCQLKYLAVKGSTLKPVEEQ